MNVIIADDSRLMRERIRETISIFKQVNIVGEAETGSEALEQMDKLEPDLVILDIRMPELNGLEVLKAYRSRNKTTKILMLTNYAYDQYKDRAFENGADFFYSKSDDFDKLLSIVADLIRKNNGSLTE
jgi:DNA-binding NarL/FixJ family response regulator